MLASFFASRYWTWLRVGQFVLALAVFGVAALSPQAALGELQNFNDRLLHLSGNFLLFMSAYVAGNARLSFLRLLLFVLPYSVMIELMQTLSPGRTVDPLDLAANLSGLGLGLICALIISRMRRLLLSREQQGSSM